MAKKILLKINNCKECPFFNWNSELEENECKQLDKILFIDDTFKNNENIIYEKCPLLDEEDDFENILYTCDIIGHNADIIMSGECSICGSNVSK